MPNSQTRSHGLWRCDHFWNPTNDSLIVSFDFVNVVSIFLLCVCVRVCVCIWGIFSKHDLTVKAHCQGTGHFYVHRVRGLVSAISPVLLERNNFGWTTLMVLIWWKTQKQFAQTLRSDVLFLVPCAWLAGHTPERLVFFGLCGRHNQYTDQLMTSTHPTGWQGYGQRLVPVLHVLVTSVDQEIMDMEMNGVTWKARRGFFKK